MQLSSEDEDNEEEAIPGVVPLKRRLYGEANCENGLYGKVKKLKKENVDLGVSIATRAMQDAKVADDTDVDEKECLAGASCSNNGHLPRSVPRSSSLKSTEASNTNTSLLPAPPPDWGNSTGVSTTHLLFRLPDSTRKVCEAPRTATVQVNNL